MDSFNSLDFANLGVYQIGVLVSYVLFGVTTMQAYIYYSRFADDTRALKALVAFIWLCELTHAVCSAHTLYLCTISGYYLQITGPPSFFNAPVTLDVGFVVAGFVVAFVQGFFGFRIRVISNRLYLSLVIWFLAFVRLVICTSLVILRNAPGFLPKVLPFSTSAWVLAVCNDMLITSILVFHLRRQRAGMLERTAAISRQIIIWTIGLALLFFISLTLMIRHRDRDDSKVNAFGIIELASFVNMPNNWVWVAIFTIEARLYANSLLASLNGRTALRAMGAVPLSLIAISDDFSSGSSGVRNQKEFSSGSSGGHNQKEFPSRGVTVSTTTKVEHV
ncbi:hypothetical protein K438DRAFT_1971344 [Mycena galopus ATCC 62051]|nr:hypothetical protein K438DRAFT_1971344 [Mycena galopus ATCC 62051]